jgi:hypothetical protein
VVSPASKEDWFGFIEFKRDTFRDASQKSTAKVIKNQTSSIYSGKGGAVRVL